MSKPHACVPIFTQSPLRIGLVWAHDSKLTSNYRPKAINNLVVSDDFSFKTPPSREGGGGGYSP